ncbi:YybH family protein [candidate division KSB1 bacterium]
MDSKKALDEMKKTDLEFSTCSVENGTYAAFDKFMDDNATVYREGKHPITGREKIRKILNPNSKTKLEWEPFKAEMAESGDMGYTLGKWTATYIDSAGMEKRSSGYYVSIWKKQPDGTWKYVFDSGVNGPPADKK